MKKLALICLLSASLISAGTAFAAKYPSVAIVNNTQTDISFDYKVCNAGEDVCSGSGGYTMTKNEKRVNIKLHSPYLRMNEVYEVDDEGNRLPGGASTVLNGKECKGTGGQIIILEKNASKQFICRVYA